MSRSDRVEYWSQVLSEHSSSGQSVAEFCRQHQMSEASFYHWRKRLKGEASE